VVSDPRQFTTQTGLPGQEVRDYLIPAIATTILCCLPAGVVGIIFAVQAKSKLTAGDRDGAAKASKYAMISCIVAAALGLFGWLIFLALGGLALIGAQAPM
jgi:hypothetical protein